MTASLSLDHIGVLVADLEAARRDYDRLGFRLTPKSSHEGRLCPDGPVEVWGTGNHCAMFRQGYLELLGITDPTRHHAHIDERLSRYRGLQLIALGCRDAEALRAQWIETAPDLPPLGKIGRAVPQVAGGSRPAGFRIVYLDGYFPEAELFAIQHVDPGVLWQRELLDQPNGVVALRGATMVVPEPEATAARLAALGLDCVARDGGRRVRLERGAWIDIVAPGVAETRFPGVAPPALPSVIAAAFAVRSLRETGRCLERAEVPVQRRDDAIRIAPEHAQGCTIDFQADDIQGRSQ